MKNKRLTDRAHSIGFFEPFALILTCNSGSKRVRVLEPRCALAPAADAYVARTREA